MKKFLTLSACLAILFNGCGAPTASQSTIANNSNFVALGSFGSRIVKCTKLQKNELPDGRLRVRADILNLVNKRVDLQVDCIFKDAQGFSTGDETPFQTLILDETAQETITFTSLNTMARDYTVRVRIAR